MVGCLDETGVNGWEERAVRDVERKRFDTESYSRMGNDTAVPG